MKKIKFRHKLTRELEAMLNNPKFDISIFNKGMICYEKSGHSLTPLGKYFICTQRQKNKCKDNTEQSIKIKNFERNFLSLLDKLKINDQDGFNLIYDLEKQFIDIEKEIIKKISAKRDLMSNSIELMKQEIKKDGKIKKHDLYDLLQNFKDIIRIGYPTYLFYMLMKFASSLIEFNYDNDYDNDQKIPVIMIEKIYIKNNGRVAKIKLEGTADLLLQIIQKGSPQYLNNFNIQFETRIKFPSLNIKEAFKYFEENDYKNALSITIYGSKYKEEEKFKKLFKYLNKINNKKIIEACYFLKDYMWRDPLIYTDTPQYLYNSSLHEELEFDKIKK